MAIETVYDRPLAQQDKEMAEQRSKLIRRLFQVRPGLVDKRIRQAGPLMRSRAAFRLTLQEGQRDAIAACNRVI